MTEPSSPTLILLAPEDNVLVAGSSLSAGAELMIDGETVTLIEDIGLGHKIARRDLTAGETILKYGAPIGSATDAVARGRHVHLHNMKSDYIETYTVDNLDAFFEETGR